MKNLIWILLPAVMYSQVSFASPDHKDLPKMAPNPTFDQLKGLVGKWEGKNKMGDKEETVTISYELTAGGTALIEKLGPGTPTEMVSIYYPQGKHVAMTHYCLHGNRPELTYKKSGADFVSFEMKGKAGIKSMKEPHMRALNIKWAGQDEITQEWTSFNNGKKAEVVTFKLTRQ